MTETLPDILARLAATPADRRRPDSLPTRHALVRLRLAEFAAADYLPPDIMQELTASIDGVVAIVRAQP